MVTPECLVLRDGQAHSGAWNMALDEALLEAGVTEGLCALRLYRWREATLSLGYFQHVPAADMDPQLAQLPQVKRLSGGGAILHHHEWTYSCVIPREHPWVHEPSQIYTQIHQTVIELLAGFGLDCRLRGCQTCTEDEPFLCFGRQDPHDVLLLGHKILGSAQRRRKGAVLQHGSLLWRRSPLAEQFPGVVELSQHSGCAVPESEFSGTFPEKLLRALANSIASTAEVDDVPRHVLDRARALAGQKHVAD